MPNGAGRNRSWLGRDQAERTGPALLLLSLALGGALFALDSVTVTDGAASALYGGVLVVLAERRRRGIIAAATCACAALTALSYLPAHGLTLQGDGIFRRAVSLAAIAAAAALTLRNVTEQETIDEQLQLLRLSDNALFVRSHAGVITYWGPGAERLYGWTAADAVGCYARELLRTEAPGIAAAEARLATAGRWQGDVEQTTRDGRRLTLAVTWAVQRDERGRAVGILETGVDVTRRRQAAMDLARSEARYRAIFEAAGIAIFEEDYSGVFPLLDRLRASGTPDIAAAICGDPEFIRRCVNQVRIVDVNDSAIRMFGAARKQDLLQPLSRIYLPGSTGSFSKILVALAEGRPSLSAQSFVRTLDGRPLTVQTSITFPRRENMVGVLVGIMDVTERHRAEEELARARDSLARAGRASSLGEMVASIAHEMNQPLGALVTNAEAALRWLRRDEPDRAEAEAALERIAREGERAIQVLQRIRAYQDPRQLSFAPFDLAAAIAEAGLLLRHELDARQVTVTAEIEAGLPPVFGDRIQIEQVVTNLLMNAAQAMDEAGTPTRIVTVHAAARADGVVVTEVRDTGPGIPAWVAGRLFRPFVTTKAEGIGLGLSISRSIVEGHGGQIWIGTGHAPGAAIRFTVPIAPRHKTHQGLLGLELPAG